MCIVFLIQGHPRFKLVVAANRDEYLDRPTQRAHFWERVPHVLAGRDKAHEAQYHSLLVGGRGERDVHMSPPSARSAAAAASSLQAAAAAGAPPDEFGLGETHGTWMGMTRGGRFAVITNFREHPSKQSPTAKSRGFLVRDFLVHHHHKHHHHGADPAHQSPRDYARSLAPQLAHYNGFNLVVGDANGETWYTGNRATAEQIRPLEPGHVYGLSNGELLLDNETWPKVIKGKELFAQALSEARCSAPACIRTPSRLTASGCADTVMAPHTHTQATSVRDLLDRLLAMLARSEPFPQDQLPPNMFNYDLEAALSPICIERERLPARNYATRTHTVIIVDNNDRVLFAEMDRFRHVPDAAHPDQRFVREDLLEVFEFDVEQGV
ncbi:UV-damaged DNA-binding protein rad7 [Polyrhizophydium stewartii]|uniref:UV-damaged DNA-binding protein rad7 n=1 Tax=Polyrhizophydium stewartii TaxID=2732419 RepID=A0ABR4NJ52_9FUNG